MKVSNHGRGSNFYQKDDKKRMWKSLVFEKNTTKDNLTDVEIIEGLITHNNNNEFFREMYRVFQYKCK